jgi:hypothetical protein
MKIIRCPRSRPATYFSSQEALEFWRLLLGPDLLWQRLVFKRHCGTAFRQVIKSAIGIKFRTHALPEARRDTHAAGLFVSPTPSSQP